MKADQRTCDVRLKHTEKLCSVPGIYAIGVKTTSKGVGYIHLHGSLHLPNSREEADYDSIPDEVDGVLVRLTIGEADRPRQKGQKCKESA